MVKITRKQKEMERRATEILRVARPILVAEGFQCLSMDRVASQMEFAKKLSYNPWHTIAEHRPLGNQSRARQRMYYELSKLRHTMNSIPHFEPTGDEVFD